MVECADSRHATLCDADSRGFIVVAFCSAILHHWMCKIPTEVATLTHVWSPLKNRVHMKLDQDEINLETALSQVMKSMSETIR
ncbi:hypothetical protein Psal071_01665 [Piscirickettsia salmonis]|uniref:Uncharacterized protein n=1 Tax=Piscirickettsia salmonis TaxID=1238 RepID=A0A9Q6LT78_PISSA|nr:transposase [Piscirickettsia salmonis]QGN77242.1 hypothetical protein Psal001_01448 [Piscirickettsia salmonis]QGN80859.1 hypothetical protein Psal002_01500 [Piscirickettsia salmonis]QGN84865.1 hypothetical protein Psal003_01928 [Piscirickettsia salmonis]QGN88374.1 hypothetical protein Psal004_01923 [Piscirickettsia salmonis]